MKTSFEMNETEFIFIETNFITVAFSIVYICIRKESI